MKLVIIKLAVVLLLSLLEPVGNLLHSIQYHNPTPEEFEHRATL
jgi:hypothetical protein